MSHLSFSQEYSKKVEEKQIALQNAERSKYSVDKAKEIKKGIIIMAEGDAKNIELIGK